MLEKSLETRDSNSITCQEAKSNNSRIDESNRIWITGVIEEEFEYSHGYWSDEFYKTRVIVTRNSGIEDFVPIMVPSVLIPNISRRSLKGKYVEVGGRFSSNNYNGHLQLYLFANAINVYENEEELEVKNGNIVYLEGYICKPPVYRVTPKGREITDLLIAVNRKFGKSDYIPCIAWGRAAIYAGKMKVGDKIKLYGRVQSREYFKRFSSDPEDGEYREAYEISIRKFIKVEEFLLQQ